MDFLSKLHLPTTSMAHIYTNNPISSFSLDEFTSIANNLHSSEEYDAFITFVLTGEFQDRNGVMGQAFIDSFRGPIDVNHPLNVSRDYDSAIGISEDILIDGPISVYAVPHPTYALKKSVHMKRTIEHKGVSLDFMTFMP